jgi:hypothetical protein
MELVALALTPALAQTALAPAPEPPAAQAALAQVPAPVRALASEPTLVQVLAQKAG